MRITIKSIEAEIINASTNTEDNFIIDYWVIKYEIILEEGHTIEGTLKWDAVPYIYKIIKFIKWFYGKRNTNTPEPI
jgi:hypothetical protein